MKSIEDERTWVWKDVSILWEDAVLFFGDSLVHPNSKGPVSFIKIDEIWVVGHFLHFFRLVWQTCFTLLQPRKRKLELWHQRSLSQGLGKKNVRKQLKFNDQRAYYFFQKDSFRISYFNILKISQMSSTTLCNKMLTSSWTF